MNKKILFFAVIIMVTTVLIFGIGYFFPKSVKAPEKELSPVTNFKGPTGEPYVKGPNEPPPGY